MKQKRRSIKKKADIKNQTLTKVYFTPKKPGSFGGVNKLHNNLKSKITQKQVKAWLASKDTYTLHKPLKKKFLRRKFIMSGIDSLWQCDLADFSKLKSENQGYQYILVCIDVFSRYAMARIFRSLFIKHIKHNQAITSKSHKMTRKLLKS